jgi:hypothetical protein
VPSALDPIRATTFLGAVLIDGLLNGVGIAPVHVVGMLLIIAGDARIGRSA